MARLSNEDLREMREQLAEHREEAEQLRYSFKVRMGCCPIFNSRELFNFHSFPCLHISKRLVFKIIDELLYDPKGGR